MRACGYQILYIYINIFIHHVFFFFLILCPQGNINLTGICKNGVYLSLPTKKNSRQLVPLPPSGQINKCCYFDRECWTEGKKYTEPKLSNSFDKTILPQGLLTIWSFLAHLDGSVVIEVHPSTEIIQLIRGTFISFFFISRSFASYKMFNVETTSEFKVWPRNIKSGKQTFH